jgi:regulatory protein SWI6
MDAKQAQIDAIHVKLRDSSAALGKERSRLEAMQQQAKEREERKLKIANLTKAQDEERARLVQLEQQYGQMNSDGEMKLGYADKGLAIPAGAIPANILSNINPNHHQAQVLDQAQRQLLSSLPPAHILLARVNAYKANNEALSESVRALQSKSSDLAAKYRKIISLCTHVDENKVDSVLDSLLRAVESEQDDVELSRVREFLHRVEGVE